MKFSFSPVDVPSSGGLVLGVFEGNDLTPMGRHVDTIAGGSLTRALDASAGFEAKAGQTLVLPVVTNLGACPIILVGLGTRKNVDAVALESFGATAQASVSTAMVVKASIAAEAALAPTLTAEEVAAHVALGARLRAYRFDKYHTTRKPEEQPKLQEMVVLADDPAKAESACVSGDALVQGVYLTRDLVSEPANVLGPEEFVSVCRPLEDLGLGVEVLDGEAMAKLGMGALLGVAQGSARPARLLILSWSGGKSGDAPTAVVGKGVCFDSGGISIKPSAGMEDMKWDMAGAAVVVGLMKTLALRKAPVNVVGLCGLVENMPSGTAQRPGDVVTSMSGQTIEIINTDAEGRLVLADVLHYANTRYKPARMIDLATLTGAILVALGGEYAGLFSNDDALSEALTAAGERVGEPLWRMPMNDAYDKMINSDIADMKNAGSREGSAITAAQLLQRFVGKTPWAHLDIAGVTWTKKDKGPIPKGGTAFGVRLLDTYFRELAG